MAKFFVDQDKIKDGWILIDGQDATHLKTVLRCREGEEITVCDGKGTDFYCRIREFTPEGVLLDRLEQSKCDTEPSIEITLFQGLPKGDKKMCIRDRNTA